MNRRYLFAFLALMLLLGSWMRLRHAHEGTYNWRTALWADQVGYYIYLPAFFIYDFDAKALPPNITESTGHGFEVDLETGKIRTKYTCGVALLQAPFFLAMHAYHHLKKPTQDGFSGRYHQVPHWAALFYGVLGLLLLYAFLRQYYARGVGLLTVGLLFLGTNLSYYLIDHTGMSHVYSFFLFAVVLWCFKKILQKAPEVPLGWWLGLSLAAALIVLIRPTNALFVGLVLLLEVRSWAQFKARLLWLLRPKLLLSGLGVLLLVLLPQLLYWQYVSGSLVHYSYGNEGFPYWNRPKLGAVWFAPNNGLLTYTPLLLLLPLAIGVGWKKQPGAWQSGVAFLVVSYLCGAWHLYSFGCGFGARNFVEYTALFALPFGALVALLFKKGWLRWVLALGFVASIGMTQKLFFTFDKCFFGQDDWDYAEYQRLLFRGYHRQGLTPENTTEEYLHTVKLHTTDYLNRAPFEQLWLEAHVVTEDASKPLSWVVETHAGDSLVQWQQIPIQPYFASNDRSAWIRTSVGLPHDLPRQDLWHKVYFWNPERAPVRVLGGHFSLK